MSGQKIAGGMSYRTSEGIDYTYIEHLFEEGNPSEIFEKKKEYYLASANKTMVRLILARTRINNIKLNDDVASILNQKISKGINWLETLKLNIKKSDDDEEFRKAISYKQWHAVKLIPQAAEAYALSCFIEAKLKRPETYIKTYEDADLHNKKAKNLLGKIINSDKNTNFKLREEQLSKAYYELNLALKSFRSKNYL